MKDFNAQIGHFRRVCLNLFRVIRAPSSNVRRFNSSHYGDNSYFVCEFFVDSCSDDYLSVWRDILCYKLSHSSELLKLEVWAACDVNQCACCPLVVNVKQWMSQSLLY